MTRAPGRGDLPAPLQAWRPHFVCPECGGGLRLDAAALRCEDCRRAYAVDHGVPLLLPDALREIREEDEAAWMAKQAQLEEQHVDLDGDSFRRKMLETVPARGGSEVRDSFFWEKRLFPHLSKDLDLRKRVIGSFEDRNGRTVEMLKRKPGLAGQVVLNVGPGSDADLIARLEEAGATVMNCDVVRDSLQFLAGQGKQLVVAGDLRRLPFRTGVFDLVLAAEVIHHIHPVGGPLAECHRVLKPGGTLCLVELNRNNLLAIAVRVFPRFVRRWQRRLVRRLLRRDSRPGMGSPYERILSRGAFRAAVLGAGFERFESRVLNYVNPIFPGPITAFLEAAGRRLRVLADPVACRYLLTAVKPGAPGA